MLRQARNCIRYSDIQGLKSACEEISQSRVNHAHFYKMLFLCACQYGCRNTIIWFVEVFFEFFSAIERIALRQTFFYGKHLVSKNAHVDTHWYDSNILSVFRMRR